MLDLWGLDTATRIDCQASPVSYIRPVMITYFPQGLGHFLHGKRLPLCAQVAILNNPISFLDLLLQCLCYLFTIDRASCVRFACVKIVLQNQGT